MTQFDVFLAYNGRDKAIVEQLASHLQDVRGLSVWFDTWIVRPGFDWQGELEKGIQTSEAGVIFVGKDGLGPWQTQEMRALLQFAVRREIPVIPVLLPGAPSEPDLSIFLANRQFVDLRNGLEQDGLDRLVWGITGEPPANSSQQGQVSEPLIAVPRRFSRLSILAVSAMVIVSMAWMITSNGSTDPARSVEAPADKVQPKDTAMEELRRLGFDCNLNPSSGQEGGGDPVWTIEGRRLDITNLKETGKLLARLTAPHQLWLDECQKLVTLEGLQKETKLEHLFVSHCNELHALSERDDQHLADIFEMPSLTSLVFESCKKINSFRAIGRSESLVSLRANACPALSSLWSEKRALGRLRKLDLADCDQLTNLIGCRGLPALEEVNLQGCESLNSLEGLQHLPNLLCLDLQHCTQLPNLDDLEDLPKLCSLDLYGCKELTSVQGVEELPRIQHLDLRRCAKLTSLQPLTNRQSALKLLLGGNVALEDLGLGQGVEYASIYTMPGDATLARLIESLPESQRARFNSRRTGSLENNCDPCSASMD